MANSGRGRGRPRKNGADSGGDAPIIPEAKASNRAETIRDACRQLADLEGKRKAIGAEIASLKQTLIKGDLGMKIADFNTAYRLYQLDGDDRDQLIDTLKECFEALGIGGQLDFIDAMGATPQRPPPQPAEPVDDQRGSFNWEAGRQAAHEGKIASVACPWGKGVRARDTWMAGHAAGLQEIQDGLEPPPAAA